MINRSALLGSQPTSYRLPIAKDAEAVKDPDWDKRHREWLYQREQQAREEFAAGFISQRDVVDGLIQRPLDDGCWELAADRCGWVRLTPEQMGAKRRIEADKARATVWKWFVGSDARRVAAIVEKHRLATQQAYKFFGGGGGGGADGTTSLRGMLGGTFTS